MMVILSERRPRLLKRMGMLRLCLTIPERMGNLRWMTQFQDH